MNTEKFQRAYSEQTSVARKVFEAVPIKAPWEFKQIMAEIARQHGHSMDVRIARGCLNSLIKSKLVREPTVDCYIRTEIRDYVAPPAPKVHLAAVRSIPPVEESIVATPTQLSTEKSPIEALDALKFRAIKLQELAAELAADIETVATEAHVYVERSDAEIKQLRQLKSLLKDLG